MRLRPAPPAAVAAGLLLLTGCASSREMTRGRAAFEQAYPDAHLRRTAYVGAGPLTMGLARWAMGFADDSTADALRGALRHVRRVRVQVFEADGVGAGRARTNPAAAPRTPPLRLGRGWTPVVRVRDDDTRVGVWVQEVRGRLRSVYVTSFDGEQLVLVHADGRLDTFLARLLDPASGLLPRRGAYAVADGADE